MAAALHLGLAIPNFGVQEYMRHTPETDAVFPHAWRFADGMLHPGDAPGIGVEIDEALADTFTYARAHLPVNRLEDGTTWSCCCAGIAFDICPPDTDTNAYQRIRVVKTARTSGR